MKPSITTTSRPNLIGQPEVTFRQNDFDALVFSKGYDVTHEKAILCPCRDKSNGSPLSNCQNCSGTGWFFINANSTRMVLQSLSLKTKYSQWSRENSGTITVTSRYLDQLGYMDRLLVKNSEAIYTQVLHPVLEDDKFFSFTVYDLINVIEVFAFEASNLPLIKLEPSDYSFTKGKNQLYLDLKYSNIENFTVSIRYKHYVAYHIVELMKEFRHSNVVDEQGHDKVGYFPFNAIAKRAHYILDSQNIDNNLVLDNSYTNG